MPCVFKFCFNKLRFQNFQFVSSPLHFAAQHGFTQTAKVLLRTGISQNATNKVDRTPLHVACQEGHSEIVKLLVESGADIEAKDMVRTAH